MGWENQLSFFVAIIRYTPYWWFLCLYYSPWNWAFETIDRCLETGLATESVWGFRFVAAGCYSSCKDIVSLPRITNRRIPSRKLTYPTWGKGKSSSNMPYQGDMLIPWRVDAWLTLDERFPMIWKIGPSPDCWKPVGDGCFHPCVLQASTCLAGFGVYNRPSGQSFAVLGAGLVDLSWSLDLQWVIWLSFLGHVASDHCGEVSCCWFRILVIASGECTINY